jgi:Esterase-like activity of phytase
MMKQVKNHWLLGVVSLHVGLSFLALAHSQNSNVSSAGVEILELPAKSATGIPIEELSGLAWDDQAKLLYAVSDRGFLNHFSLQPDTSGDLAVTSVWSGKIEANTANSRNAEGLAIKREGSSQVELLVALEDPTSLSFYSKDGKLTGDSPIPTQLTHESVNDGIEAVSFIEDGNIAYALEKPIEPESSTYHEIIVTRQGTTDRRIRFSRASGLDTRVKAIESLGNNEFLVLERDKNNTNGAYRNFLTKLSQCKGDALLMCETETALADGQNLPNEALEGMAILDDGSIILVEDRKRKAGPTRLFIVQP